jgi:hypothetical protein
MNQKDRIVYGYFFDSERICYIGLTCSPKSRHSTHCLLNGKSESPVATYTLRNSSLPRKQILSDGFIKESDAAMLEEHMIEFYKKAGWITLNKMKAGGLGGGSTIKWTKENCLKEALKYNSRSEFQYNAKTAYVAASANKWLDEICSHMIRLKHPNNYWDNKNNCEEAAKQYKTRNEFATKKRQAYRYALKYGWLNEFFPKTINIS